MHGLLIARDESCSQDQPPDSLQTLGSFRRLFFERHCHLAWDLQCLLVS